MATVTYVEIDVNKPIHPLAGAREALIELRRTQFMGQIAFAKWLGVSQSVVAKWETGARPVPYKTVLLLATSVTDPAQREFWGKLAGIKPLGDAELENTREVPLLRDAAACGTPRAVDEKEIEEVLSFPQRWLPRGGSIFAIKVVGDSMSPLLEEGYIVLVDIASRSADKLADRMILARDGDEVTVKWLRRQESMLLLVPQNTSPRHAVRVWTRSDNRAIVGEVVCWIGQPPRPRKRK